MIHLAYEARVWGPVQYRWMYPFERYMHSLKKKVKNKARVEGSIMEAYIIEKILNFRRLMMLALFIGIVLIAFTVIAALPMGLAWGQDILLFLRGGLPIFAAFVGLISVFIGIADIKDKQDARKEEAAMKVGENKNE